METNLPGSKLMKILFRGNIEYGFCGSVCFLLFSATQDQTKRNEKRIPTILKFSKETSPIPFSVLKRESLSSVRMKQVDLSELIQCGVGSTVAVFSNLFEITCALSGSMGNFIEHGQCCSRERQGRILSTNNEEVPTENDSHFIPSTYSTECLHRNDIAQCPDLVSQDKKTSKFSQIPSESPRSDTAIDRSSRRRKSTISSRRHSVESGAELYQERVASSKHRFAAVVSRSRQDEAIIQSRIAKARRELLNNQYPTDPAGGLLISGSGRNPRPPH